MPLRIEDDDRTFATCGTLEIAGNEVLQSVGLTGAAAADDPVVGRADRWRKFGAKRNLQKVGKRRAAKKRGWIVDIAWGDKLGLLASATWNDPRNSIDIVLISRGESGKQIGRKGLHKVFDKSAGRDQRGQGRNNFAVHPKMAEPQWKRN